MLEWEGGLDLIATREGYRLVLFPTKAEAKDAAGAAVDDENLKIVKVRLGVER
jgi:hypothetical protein